MGNKLLNFKVSSHLKNIIGRDLITDKYVAIFELVKNSVDAKAKNIDVIINENEIIIEDDGIGMSLDDIENKWLFIGYSEKKDSKEMVAGNKGIGRFSADNLAENLELKTKNKTGEKIVIDIDWNLFEDNQMNKITEIDIPYKVTNDNSKKSGTTLRLRNLRSYWEEKDIKKLKRNLEKLTNPFEEKKEIIINLISENFSEYNGIIENNLLEILNEKSIFLELTIKNSIFQCSLIHNKKEIVKFSYYQETVLEDIKIKLYHLPKGAKGIFTKRMGIDFKNYGNIFIYRNGFRIYPYGEIDFDTFNLNLRKTQGYNRFLGLRDLIGSISIKDTKNNFKEVSSRDNGFIKNISYLELENIYMEYHRFLEDFMQITLFNTTMNYDINDQIIKRFRKKENLSVLFGKKEKVIKYKDVISKIEKDIPLTTKEKKVIKDNEKKIKIDLKEFKNVEKENIVIKKENQNLKKEIMIKNKILEDDQYTNLVNREMFNHHINTQINELKAIIKNYKKTLTEPTDKNFIEFEKNYYEIIYKFLAIKNTIFSFKDKKIGKEKMDIVQFIEEYSMNWMKKNNLKISVFSNNIVHVVSFDVMDFIIVLDNLFENAEKAEASQINITIEKENSILKITLISKESNVENLQIEKVFDYGYTTRKRSTGMGMFFVKQILNEKFKANVDVKIINNDFITLITMR